MNLTVTNIQQQYDANRKQQLVLTLRGTTDISKYEQMIAKGEELVITIKRKPRSLEANSYLWVMCQKISEVTRQTPEHIYRHHIREVGQHTYLPIKNEAVDRFCEIWAHKGIGWFAEPAWESKGIPGYTTVKAYYGSSVYDSKEMSILIDELVQECKRLGIETESPAEIERLKKEWRA